jgi:sorbitol-specific phosphotransferase system component IIC
VLGALGLVLPGLTGIKRQLTSVAAGCLAVIMAGAVVVTVMMQGVLPALFPLVVGILDLIVMVGRHERGAQRVSSTV